MNLLESSSSNSYAACQVERESLRSRVLRRRFSTDYSTLLFLERGKLHFGEDGQEISGPALCFWPHAQFPKITLAPGASAKVLGISDGFILDAVGSQAESVHLRMMIEQPFQVTLQIDPRFPHVESLFEWFAFETKVPHHRSQMMLSAYLRCLLIMALRVHEPKVENESTKRSEVLRRFRHLVELHYRDHWKVADYADALGVEYDRLHRVCKRHTARTPVVLVHERLISEAKTRLEKTGHSAKEIANALGFPDGSRFSHFFKKNTGLSPGAYRKLMSQAESQDRNTQARNFADWP